MSTTIAGIAMAPSGAPPPAEQREVSAERKPPVAEGERFSGTASDPDAAASKALAQAARAQHAPSAPQGGGFLLQPAGDIFTPEDLSEEDRAIAEVTRDFVHKEVLPNLGAIESQNFTVTTGLMAKAAVLGLTAVDIPEAYGGLGAGIVTSTVVSENMGSAGSFGITLGCNNGIASLPIKYFGTEAQKQKYLPGFAAGTHIGSYALTEPASGSDALSARTKATPSEDGSHYVLNGSKRFITNAGMAKTFVVFAQVPGGPKGNQFSAFIVERGYPGVKVGAEEKKMGIKGSSTCEVMLDDVKVPAENVLGTIGKGHKIAFGILDIGRYKLGAGVVGTAKAVIADAVNYANQRKQFDTPISSFGAVQQKIGDMALRTFVGESMLYRTAGTIDRAQAGDPSIKPYEDYAIECSMLKVFNSEVLHQVANEGLQIAGGSGFIEETPFPRYYRDSRINLIFEGTNEINRMLVTGTLLKKAMKGELPLFQAVGQAQKDAMSGAAPQEEAGPLGREKGQLKAAKTAALLTAGIAAQKYAMGIDKQQEVMMGLSDMLTDIYAMESVIGRVEKILASGGKGKPELYGALAKTAVFEAVDRMHDNATRILSRASEGEAQTRSLQAVDALLKHPPFDTIESRRQIADSVINAGAYNL